MEFIFDVIGRAWHLLLDSSVYVLFGLLIAGLLRVFLSPHSVAAHLGNGRFSSVFKAAFLGIPLPLCSCGVLPAAASLKKQGANKGATTAFLISTPESGVDSIAITWALLDPVMTVARPVAAFVTAATAGVAENLLAPKSDTVPSNLDLRCPVDGCCSGLDCPPEEHASHHTFVEKTAAGLKFAFTDVWADIASWFLVGLLLAGLITALVPDELMARFFGGGVTSMVLMLAMGIPLYICATASTPIAAALILKGVSPGAALVFLLAGPATNVTSLTVLFGILGKKATALYLASIALLSVLFGLAVDQIYAVWGLSGKAMVGQAAELVPVWAQWMGGILLLALSVKPVLLTLKEKLAFTSRPERKSTDAPKAGTPQSASVSSCSSSSCGCGSEVKGTTPHGA